MEYCSEQHRGSADGCRPPPTLECRRHRILRESAHLRVPVERTGYYRKQGRSIVPQETAVPAVQRFGRCDGSNCRDASKFSGRQRMANSISTADTNSSLGSWKRAHRVSSLSRVSSGSAATDTLSSRTRAEQQLPQAPMLSTGERNTRTHLLGMPVCASLLAKAHLSLDITMLGAWTALGFCNQLRKQTRATNLLGSPGSARAILPR